MNAHHPYLLPLLLALAGCDPALVEVEVTDVEVADNPLLVLEKIVSVTLSEPAAIALQCARDDAEVHLLESSTPATEHTLRVQGLAAASDYTCAVGPVDVDVPAGAILTFHTDALPAAIPAAAGEIQGPPAGEYTLVVHQRVCAEETAIQLVLYDNDGEVRWYYPLPINGFGDMGAEYFGDGLVLWGGVSDSAEGEGAPRLVSLSHEEVYRADYPGAAVASFHHSAEKLADGTVITLTEESVSDGEHSWVGFGVHRIDTTTDQLVWSWQLQEALDAGELEFHGLQNWGANWAGVMFDGLREVVVVSLCEGKKLLAIDPTSRSVAWLLGGSESLAVSGGTLPECQHGPAVQGQHLLLYDNAWSSPTSRIVEFEIDAAAGTAEQTWSWTEPGWAENVWGDVDYVGDHHVLVTRGHIACFTDGEGPSQVVELDRANGDAEVWRLILPDPDDSIYGSHRIDGCAIFADTSRCPELAGRLPAVARWLSAPE